MNHTIIFLVSLKLKNHIHKQDTTIISDVTSEICYAIAKKHPYYNLKEKVWQNGISLTLSANKDKLFAKLDRKGGFWKLLPKGEECYKSKK